jgi:hypothetical protein
MPPCEPHGPGLQIFPSLSGCPEPPESPFVLNRCGSFGKQHNCRPTLRTCQENRPSLHKLTGLPQTMVNAHNLNRLRTVIRA